VFVLFMSHARFSPVRVRVVYVTHMFQSGTFSCCLCHTHVSVRYVFVLFMSHTCFSPVRVRVVYVTHMFQSGTCSCCLCHTHVSVRYVFVLLKLIVFATYVF